MIFWLKCLEKSSIPGGGGSVSSTERREGEGVERKPNKCWENKERENKSGINLLIQQNNQLYILTNIVVSLIIMGTTVSISDWNYNQSWLLSLKQPDVVDLWYFK